MKKTSIVLMSACLVFAACSTTASLSPEEDGGTETSPAGDGDDGGDVTADARAGFDASPVGDGGAFADDGSEPLEDGGNKTDAEGETPLPDGGTSPIKYIVVIVKENHTFDNYFTGFPGATSSTTAKLSTGKTLTRPTAPDGPLSRNLCHSHECATEAYDAGGMDGLDNVSSAAAPKGGKTDDLAYIRYQESQLPNYWQYARNFVLADNFFSTTFANSFPGHFATTSGFNVALDNPACNCTGTCNVIQYTPGTCAQVEAKACWDYPSVVFNLPQTYTWTEYGGPTLLSNSRVIKLPNYASHFKEFGELQADLASASQPNLIFAHVTGSVSEHPPQDPCPGENNSVELLNTIMKSPHWNETAVLLLWDDWGGFYDSVSPEAPRCPNKDFVHPGFRIPLMIISPYAKKGYVLKTKSEQASVVRLIEDVWGLPRMSGEDSRILDSTAGSLLDAFDFTQSPRAPFLLTTRTCQ